VTHMHTCYYDRDTQHTTAERHTQTSQAVLRSELPVPGRIGSKAKMGRIR